MFEWWNALSTIQQVFYILAIPSTIILVLQTILLLFGIGGDHDADISADTDAGMDIDAEMDADGSFVPEHDMPHEQGAALLPEAAAERQSRPEKCRGPDRRGIPSHPLRRQGKNHSGGTGSFSGARRLLRRAGSFHR